MNNINEDIETVEREAFNGIKDLNSLNWAFRKLHAIKEKESDIQNTAKKEKERITDWEKHSLKQFEGDKEYFQSLITVYHMQQLEEDPKAKTLSTPYGKSKSRASKESVDKSDEGILLEYAIENQYDEFLESKLKWGELKKAIKIVEISGEKVAVDMNGQLVPGIVVKPATINYSLDVE